MKSLSFKSSQFREFIMAFSLFWKDCDEGSAFGELVQEMELRNVEIQQLCRKVKKESSLVSYRV